jgi:hypothetical protein
MGEERGNGRRAVLNGGALDPVARESALQRHDSVVVQSLAVGADVDPRRFRRYIGHSIAPFLARLVLARNGLGGDKVPREANGGPRLAKLS